MNDYEEIENDDRLAQRLRREARRIRPVFSTELHERMMSAIQSASAPTPALSTHAWRGSPTRAIPRALPWVMTAAASIALAIALLLVLNRSWTPSRESIANGKQGTPRQEIAVNLPDTVPTIDIVHQEPTTKKDAEDFNAAAEELANSASGIGDWVRSAAGDGQWGGLDRDAQRALATVAGPLPFDLTFSVATADGD